MLPLPYSLFLAYTYANPTFYSSGPPSPCPDFRQTNGTTTFNVSLTPDNNTLSFEASGLDTIQGNATFTVSLLADGEQAYLTKQDPCSDFDSAELCPANGVPSSLGRMNYNIPERLRTTVGRQLLSANNITAQLWVDITPVGEPVERTSCFQTRLRSDDENAGESNSTSSPGADVSSDNSNSTSDDESGASVLRVTFSLAM